jgi:hypothetical protein
VNGSGRPRESLSLSTQEYLLNLHERRVLGKPFSLSSVLVAKCVLDMCICDCEEFLQRVSISRFFLFPPSAQPYTC